MSVPTAIADAARLRECVHCGLCLNACPTYLELGTEADSPRGRIHLIRAVEEGTLALDAEVVRHLDLCLGCRACESACPSGVRYGEILESARAFVAARAPRPWWDQARRRAVLAIFPHRRRLRALLGLAALARMLGMWPLVTRWVAGAALLPAPAAVSPPAAVTPASGPARRRVGLLRGCVGDVLFGGVTAAATRVLARHGATVVVPPAQGCCGALHLHGGDPATARTLARRLLDAFPADLDALAVTAAGCGATLREYGALLADDPVYAGRARDFAARVRDVSEVLVDLGADARPGGAGAPAPPRRVAYHDACHLAHAQGVHTEPRALLAAVPGVTLVELAESDVCCGSAGTYNLVEPAMAQRLRERKIDCIVASGADCVVAANPGCALQIRAGLAARGLTVPVLHPVEVLAERLDG